MDKTKDEHSWGELAFTAISKIIWLGIALSLTYILYNLILGFFYSTLGFTSNFWVVMSGSLSFWMGMVANRLYDTAFD